MYAEQIWHERQVISETPGQQHSLLVIYIQSYQSIFPILLMLESSGTSVGMSTGKSSTPGGMALVQIDKAMPLSLYICSHHC